LGGRALYIFYETSEIKEYFLGFYLNNEILKEYFIKIEYSKNVLNILNMLS
jgi:hypothetical protein